MTAPASKLRRDLGTLESYATVIGILIGAGIFVVTGDGWGLTGPSVILGYIVLIPAILATAIPYAAYLSTSHGETPGGEYLNISRTLGGYRLAYVGAWLKIISYIGAGAYLANAMADHVIKVSGGRIEKKFQLPLALAALVLFYSIHAIGILWFGRTQVILSALKCLALLVFIVPGLFVLKLENYTPFFTHGAGGFATSLLPLFFAYAGFESICQTAGEVKDSKRRLPGILVRGITITALIYIFTSIVAFGVVAGGQLGKGAQIATVAAAYLPPSAALFVTLGAIAAFMTALNGTILVPSRLALTLVEDGLAPRWLGTVNEKTRVPIVGLTLTMLCCAILLVSGQISLALNIAVFALIMLYFIHSLVFLFLPRWNPALASEIKIDLSPRVRQLVTVVSLVSMGVMILIQLLRDVEVLRTSTLAQRIAERSLTSIELVFVWGIIGLVLYQLARMQRRNTVAKADAHGD